MIIKSIELKNFRNYESLKVELDEKTNILYGKNAQGKTNLLEAAYMCSTTKSHRASKDKEMIKLGEEEAFISSVIEKDKTEYKIDIKLQAKRAKIVSINRVPLKKSTEIFGIVQMIFFSPEDLDIVKRGPQERRRFLDMELCQIDKLYLYDLTMYKKTISQRNKLLKDIEGDKSLISMLSVWDEKLLYHGRRIISRRREFVEELKDIAFNNYSKIAANKEKFEVIYEPNVTEDNFESKISEYEKKDLILKQTNVGPHRDDIGIFINGMDARIYGSQGQQRSAALSLKLSEIEIMESHTGNKPILLLDDVLSELDTDRQKALLSGLYEVQTILTCTGMEEIRENGLSSGKVFIVENANINEA